METMISFLEAYIYLMQKDIPPNVLVQIGGYKDCNLNKMVQQLLDTETTHILFLDTDMSFPNDTFHKLLLDDKAIVGGNYNTRMDPTSGNSYLIPTTKMRVNGEMVSMVAKDFPTELFKCAAVPLGMLMVKTEVFKKLKMPYFEDRQVAPKFEHMTEDVDFCIKAQQAGYDIWCNPSIDIRHIGVYAY